MTLTVTEYQKIKDKTQILVIMGEGDDLLDVVMEDGGIVSVHNNGEQWLTSYHQSRIDLDDDDMWETPHEGKIYHNDWGGYDVSTEDIIKDAVEWMNAFKGMTGCHVTKVHLKDIDSFEKTVREFLTGCNQKDEQPQEKERVLVLTDSEDDTVEVVMLNRKNVSIEYGKECIESHYWEETLDLESADIWNGLTKSITKVWVGEEAITDEIIDDAIKHMQDSVNTNGYRLVRQKFDPRLESSDDIVREFFIAPKPGGEAPTKNPEDIEFLRKMVSAFDCRNEYLNDDKTIDQLLQEYRDYCNDVRDLDGNLLD